MDLSTPPRWRKGQTIFNFLWWLKTDKGFAPEPRSAGRMADPFHIPDAEFDKLLDEFISQHS